MLNRRYLRSLVPRSQVSILSAINSLRNQALDSTNRATESCDREYYDEELDTIFAKDLETAERCKIAAAALLWAVGGEYCHESLRNHFGEDSTDL